MYKRQDALGSIESVTLPGEDGEPRYVPIVTDSIFQCDEQPLFTFGVEICEDLWVPNPPSTTLAQMGAHIIVNLSASDEDVYKRQILSGYVNGVNGIAVPFFHSNPMVMMILPAGGFLMMGFILAAIQKIMARKEDK